MRKNRIKWIIISSITIVVLFFGFQKWGSSLNPAAETLSQQEAQQLVEERYKGGKVTNIELKDEQYIIEMNRSEILYEIKLDAQRGEIVSFSKIEKDALPEESISKQEPANPKQLTEEEIKSAILSETPGELLFFKKINEKGQSLYKAIILENDQKTVLKVDANTGKVLFRKVEKDKEAVAKITEEEAGQIALKEINGSINDVDLEEEDNLIFYLVEIDTPDDKEAIVQIDAITGAILTITWDD